MKPERELLHVSRLQPLLLRPLQRPPLPQVPAAAAARRRRCACCCRRSFSPKLHPPTHRRLSPQAVPVLERLPAASCRASHSPPRPHPFKTPAGAAAGGRVCPRVHAQGVWAGPGRGEDAQRHRALRHHRNAAGTSACLVVNTGRGRHDQGTRNASCGGSTRAAACALPPTPATPHTLLPVPPPPPPPTPLPRPSP